MLFYALNIFSVAFFGLSSAGELTLPVTTCKRNSVDYSSCLIHALREAWPRFVKGLPEFDFPSFDPLHYKYGTIKFNSGDIHAVVSLSDTFANGLQTVNFNAVKPHFLDDTFRLEIDAQVPKIVINGTVIMNGTLGIFRINNEGPFNLITEDVISTWDLTGLVVNDTWIIEHIRLLPSVKKLKIYFNLFPDSKEINDLVVGFTNEFWPPLYRVMLPLSSEIWDTWLTNIVNKLFSKVSFSKLFPS